MISDIEWKQIRQVVADAQRAAMHCSIATVNSKGFPSITPIGTVFLNKKTSTGFFFDTYSTTLSENLQHQPLACIQAVNSSKLFGFHALLKGKFKRYPGVRLYAEIGPLRPASSGEVEQAEWRIRGLDWTEGSQLIRASVHHVRESEINRYRWVEYAKMQRIKLIAYK